MTTTDRRRRLLSTAALVPVLALILSGCAFGFSPDGPPGTGDDGPVSTSTPPVDSGSDDNEPADEDADILTRENIAARATQQVTCQGGELEVAEIAIVVEVTDDCARLVVSGNGATVLGASVDELEVSGVAAVVFVADVATLRVTGNGSTVLWESGSPSIHDESVASVLLAAGAQR